MLKSQLLDLCNQIAPGLNLDPLLVMAICTRESGKGDLFEDDACRLENGFYHRYTEKDSLATTTEVLFACSYGVMQVMGESLREMKYFDFFKTYYNERNSFQLTDGLSEVAVPKAINAFMVRPQWQVEWGSKWFLVKLRLAGGSDIRRALQLWNGGGNPSYGDEVLEIFNTLSGGRK